MLSLCTGIQRLVLAGRMGEAIDTTYELYPGILEHNPNLLFMLKCRQFIEMVNGTDSQVRAVSMRSPRSNTGSARNSPSMSPVHTSLLSPSTVKTSPPIVSGSSNSVSLFPASSTTAPPVSSKSSPHSSPHPHATDHATQQHIIPPSSSANKNSPPSSTSPTTQHGSASEEQMNNVNTALNGALTSRDITLSCDDVTMDTSESHDESTRKHESNGVSNGCMNGAAPTTQSHHRSQDHDMGKCSSAHLVSKEVGVLSYLWIEFIIKARPCKDSRVASVCRLSDKQVFTYIN